MAANSSTVKSLEAYNLIRELILEGELLPGTRLVLADLEDKLKVGRGPIREALMRLDRSGLVQNVPFKGAVVAPLPSFQEIQCIYRMRVEVECTLALAAMEKATEAEFAELEELLEATGEPNETGHLFFHPDRAFHAAIYRIARMPHLQNMATGLVDHVEIFLNSRYYGQHDQQILVDQHRAIVDAMKRGDGNTVREMLTRNILVGLTVIQQEMTRMGMKIA